MTQGPFTLNQLNLVVRDMDATVAFYRRLGLAIEADSGAEHVAVTLPNGLLLEFDTTAFVQQWDGGWMAERAARLSSAFPCRHAKRSMPSTPTSSRAVTGGGSSRTTRSGELAMPSSTTRTATGLAS